VTDTNLFRLSQPGTFTDPLSEVLRNGARALLAQAASQKDKGAAAPFDCALGDRPSTGEEEWAAGCF
jgi:hypothetical protein